MKRNWTTIKEYSDILFDFYNGIARITINRPEVYNAFRPQTNAQMLDAMGDMSASIISQKAVLFLKGEYEKTGVDLGQLQMEYLLKTGGVMLLYAIVGTIAALFVGFLAARSGAHIGRALRDQVFRKVV